MLERLRVRKTPEELEKLRIASDLVIDSMLAVIASHGAGATKLELAEALRREETARGLVFDYCLIAAGSSHQPGAVRSALAEWRPAVGGFGRQLSRLYRRSGAHGHCRRARRRA